MDNASLVMLTLGTVVSLAYLPRIALSIATGGKVEAPSANVILFAVGGGLVALSIARAVAP